METHTDSPTGPAAQGGPPAAPAAPPIQAPAEHPLRFWLRPLLLAILALILAALTWWDQRRIPVRPVRPQVLTATPVAGTPAAGTDPALTDTLVWLRDALVRRDARALVRLADPNGIRVAAYSGGIPDDAPAVLEVSRLAEEALSGSQVTALSWRVDGRGRVIALTEGWRRKPLHLGGAPPFELTPLAAVGLVQKGERWYWTWLLPDTSGALAQQARSMVWQPWPS